jgi:hypothetical protein
VGKILFLVTVLAIILVRKIIVGWGHSSVVELRACSELDSTPSTKKTKSKKILIKNNLEYVTDRLRKHISK